MSAWDTVSRTEDIEVGSDLEFERRWWRIQRIAWIIFSLLLLGGLLGLFGHGPYSKATENSPGGELAVHFDRLARRETPCVLELHLQQAALVSGEVRVHVNQALLKQMQIKQIVPAPFVAEPLADGARFVFRIDPRSDAACIRLVENPTSPGFVDAEVAVENAEPVRFRQFIYP